MVFGRLLTPKEVPVKEYELRYVQPRPAGYDKNVLVPERKTEIIEADGYDEAECKAALFLAGRAMISLRCLHLPEPGTIAQPKPEFIPEDELYDKYERF